MHQQGDLISSNNHHYNYCPEAHSSNVPNSIFWSDNFQVSASGNIFLFLREYTCLAFSRVVCYLRALELDVIPNSLVPKYFSYCLFCVKRKMESGRKDQNVEFSQHLLVSLLANSLGSMYLTYYTFLIKFFRITYFKHAYIHIHVCMLICVLQTLKCIGPASCTLKFSNITSLFNRKN